jgi:hypothetical protein
MDVVKSGICRIWSIDRLYIRIVVHGEIKVAIRSHAILCEDLDLSSELMAFHWSSTAMFKSCKATCVGYINMGSFLTSSIDPVHRVILAAVNSMRQEHAKKRV